MPNAVTTGGGALLATLLGSSMMGGPAPDTTVAPVVFESVNVDNALLATWTSEDISSNSDEPLEHECAFFNFSKSFTSPYCDPFTLSRMNTHTVLVAQSRALRCAAKHAVECILSLEVGLAVPAAFLARHGADTDMLAVVAPRILPSDNATIDYVRVHQPKDRLNTHTTRFNNTLRAEYMTAQKTVDTSVFTGSDAFCIQLLRSAFEPGCWENLDRV
jgi:hypothetical protein